MTHEENKTEPENLGARVLVVEDDREISSALGRTLRHEGYEAKCVDSGEKALELIDSFKPDLVLLDLGLPGIDGIEASSKLQQLSDAPILMLTARDSLEDRVQGLDSGADDYLVKPFERSELLARMRALFRRRPPKGTASIVLGDISLNRSTREVRRSERAIELTAREFELLEYMMQNSGIVVSRQKLLDQVWEYDPYAITNTVDVFVSSLRRKLESGGEDRVLTTVRGVGYMFKAKP